MNFLRSTNLRLSFVMAVLSIGWLAPPAGAGTIECRQAQTDLAGQTGGLVAISRDPHFQAKLKQIQDDPRLDDMQKTVQISRLWVDARINSLPPDQQEEARRFLADPSFGAWVQPQNHLKFKLADKLTREMLIYHVLLERQVARISQQPRSRRQRALRWMDKYLNPLPTLVFKTAAQEREALGAEYDFMRLFSDKQIAAAREQLKNTDFGENLLEGEDRQDMVNMKALLLSKLDQSRLSRDEYQSKQRGAEYLRLLGIPFNHYAFKMVGYATLVWFILLDPFGGEDALRKEDSVRTGPMSEICAKANGVLRGDKCWCESLQNFFNPATHTCLE